MSAGAPSASDAIGLSWLWRHDDEYTRAMTREVDGRTMAQPVDYVWMPDAIQSDGCGT